MHRTDGDSNVANKFDPGDPAVPRAPTQIDAAWLNALQEEICVFLEAAGVTLRASGAADTAAGWTQLRDTIVDVARNQSITGVKTITGGSSGYRLHVVNTVGVAARFEAGSSTGAVEAAAVTDDPAAAAIRIMSGSISFDSANPISTVAISKRVMPGGLVKGWVYCTWTNAAPTFITSNGFNVASISNTGGMTSGQIQVNLAGGVTGAMLVTGGAGASAWHVVPQNNTGLVKIVDSSGAAVNFGTTSGFAMLVVHGNQ